MATRITIRNGHSMQQSTLPSKLLDWSIYSGLDDLPPSYFTQMHLDYRCKRFIGVVNARTQTYQRRGQPSRRVDVDTNKSDTANLSGRFGPRFYFTKPQSDGEEEEERRAEGG